MHTRLAPKSLVAGIAVLALTLAGCSSGTSNASSQAATSAAIPGAGAANGATIKLAYVEWDSCVAGTNLVAAALEQAGFKVKTVSVTAAMMYEGLANRDVDGMVCAWLPTTHAAYYAKTKDRLANLGPNMSGTRIGLVVPDYVTIGSITDLANAATAKKFDGRIVGIDPGAGIMEATEKALTAYNLPEKLVSGSDATMTAVLGNEIRQKKWVVVTGWTPHWMWARWQLKYLEDPKGTYGKPEDIYTLVRKGLQQDDPKAYAILDTYQRSDKITDQVMADDLKPGAKPKEVAQKWVTEHPEVVSKWLAAD